MFKPVCTLPGGPTRHRQAEDIVPDSTAVPMGGRAPICEVPAFVPTEGDATVLQGGIPRYLRGGTGLPHFNANVPRFFYPR